MNDIGIGLIGTGKMAAVHADAYGAIDGARIVAVTDSDGARAAAFGASRHLSVAPGLGDLLSDETVQLVDVCTPTIAHYEIVAAALESGKHAVTEKPLARSHSESTRIVELAEQKDRLLFVAHVLRFWPEYVAAHQWLRSGRLGRALAASSYRLSVLPQWNTWFGDQDQSGGVVLDLQIHDIDFWNWCFGRPTRINSQRVEHAGQPGDEVHTLLTYPDARVQTVASYLMPDSYPFTAGFRITFEAGAIEFRSRAGTADVLIGEAGSSLTLYVPGSRASTIDASGEDPFIAELRHVVDCVKLGVPSSILSPREACEAVEVCEASARSCLTGQPVDLGGTTAASR